VLMRRAMPAGARSCCVMPSDGAHVARWGRARLCAVLWKRDEFTRLPAMAAAAGHGGGQPAAKWEELDRESEGGAFVEWRGRGVDRLEDSGGLPHAAASTSSSSCGSYGARVMSTSGSREHDVARRQQHDAELAQLAWRADPGAGPCSPIAGVVCPRKV
jgi:hypothetical protein